MSPSEMSQFWVLGVCVCVCMGGGGCEGKWMDGNGREKDKGRHVPRARPFAPLLKGSHILTLQCSLAWCSLK
jgi:hypothetical protein